MPLSLDTYFDKDIEYRKEMERLGIDLSWKSSQIEGNTYSLLEQNNIAAFKQIFIDQFLFAVKTYF